MAQIINFPKPKIQRGTGKIKLTGVAVDRIDCTTPDGFCVVCGNPIRYGREFCSEECEELSCEIGPAL